MIFVLKLKETIHFVQRITIYTLRNEDMSQKRKAAAEEAKRQYLQTLRRKTHCNYTFWYNIYNRL
jgi:hypothetical protein